MMQKHILSNLSLFQRTSINDALNDRVRLRIASFKSNHTEGVQLPSPTTKIVSGSYLQKRRNGNIREVVGFTTKPSDKQLSDGVRRVRLYDDVTRSETRVRLDQITKTYKRIS